MKFARKVNNKAVDVVDSYPSGQFHPSILAEFLEVPDEVENGWVYSSANGGSWSAPEQVAIAEEPIEVNYEFTRPQFKLLFSAPERLQIASIRQSVDANNSPTDANLILNDIFDILEDVETKVIDVRAPYVGEMLEFLVQLSVLTPERKIEIMGGVIAGTFNSAKSQGVIVEEIASANT